MALNKSSLYKRLAEASEFFYFEYVPQALHHCINCKLRSKWLTLPFIRPHVLYAKNVGKFFVQPFHDFMSVVYAISISQVPVVGSNCSECLFELLELRFNLGCKPKGEFTPLFSKFECVLKRLI